jgi:hypothetical protein
MTSACLRAVHGWETGERISIAKSFHDFHDHGNAWYVQLDVRILFEADI